ncbi:MAG: 7-carboxy-7-deazaguanine synthase [Parvibaculales bacterium]
MTYSVKEIFFSLQGEGAQSGRPAVFCRFAGCNLWSGLEQDRASAQCTFCDTDFVGTDGQNGGKFKTAQELAGAIAALWPDQDSIADAYVIFTGGEPLLQLDAELLDAVKLHGFETAVETNGTLPAPQGLDWICVSPKPDSELVQTRGHELKFVYPQPKLSPDQFAGLDFEHFYLQPMDVADDAEMAHNVQACISFCLQNPQWRLSLQTHKILGLD